MCNPAHESTLAARAIVAAARRLLIDRATPILIALDGASGTGKSVLAALVAEVLGASVIPSDDFFAAEITDAEWEARSPIERAADAIDWRRLRRDALQPLRAGKPGAWRAFDFKAGVRPDGTYSMRTDFELRNPAQVIVLDGAYSTRPELGDLIDLSVLVDSPLSVRHARLSAREEAAFLKAWHARWDAAEAYYFTHVRPPSSFDLIVSTAPTRRGRRDGTR